MEHYHWDQIPKEQLDPLTARQVIHTPANTVLRVLFKAGAVSARHHHVHEQVSMLISGKVRFTLGDEKVTVNPGEVLRIPSDIEHSAEALEDSVLVDVFTPARTDWQ